MVKFQLLVLQKYRPTYKHDTKMKSRCLWCGVLNIVCGQGKKVAKGRNKSESLVGASVQKDPCVYIYRYCSSYSGDG